ncbi:MAG: hypothetical protein ACRYG8_05645 [Janthinobacterium lividum]
MACHPVPIDNRGGAPGHGTPYQGGIITVICELSQIFIIADHYVTAIDIKSHDQST